jgi:hypothetical protein
VLLADGQRAAEPVQPPAEQLDWQREPTSHTWVHPPAEQVKSQSAPWRQISTQPPPEQAAVHELPARQSSSQRPRSQVKLHGLPGAQVAAEPNATCACGVWVVTGEETVQETMPSHSSARRVAFIGGSR